MIESTYSIRAATTEDIPFLVHANATMAAETESRILDENILTAGIRAVFTDTDKARYFVAERNAKVVACLMITFEWSDWRNGSFWWIQSVYVEPQARRQGVFRRLYHHAREQAQQAGAIGLRLYVELENTRAQQTYHAMGMKRCRYHMYEIEFDSDVDSDTTRSA